MSCNHFFCSALCTYISTCRLFFQRGNPPWGCVMLSGNSCKTSIEAQKLKSWGEMVDSWTKDKQSGYHPETLTLWLCLFIPQSQSFTNKPPFLESLKTVVPIFDFFYLLRHWSSNFNEGDKKYQGGWGNFHHDIKENWMHLKEYQ